MKISIIAVGRISNSFESDLVNRYINRFNKINKLIGLNQLQIIEVDDKKYKTKQQQAKKILEIIKTEPKIVIYDQKGNLIDRYLNTNSDKLKNTIWFVVYMSDKIPNKVGKNIILLTRNEKISLKQYSLKFVIIRGI